MLRAVDLYQLAQAVAASARLMQGEGRRWRRSFPNPLHDHPPTQGLHTQAKAVTGRQFLRPRAWDRNQGNAREPEPEQLDGTRYHHDGDCSHGHACGKPKPPVHRRQKRTADDRPDDVPGPSRWPPPRLSAACPTDQSARAAGSAPVRSSGSPSSHVTPNVSTTACASDISTGDGSDISIGDLHPKTAEDFLWKIVTKYLEQVENISVS